MGKMNFRRYRSFQPVNLPDRTWPNRAIEQAPIWCSVDLRDGNQALRIPMSVDEKMEMFELLVEIGFKEIEVGFPSASETEFRFARRLIEEKRIPDDVTIQVLTQAREHLIRRTFEAVADAPRVIVHLYNSTSELQRRVVFRQDKAGIKRIAIEGARLVKELADANGNPGIRFEYTPESFTGTELDYAAKVCHAVMDVWKPTHARPVIINIPATVEMSTPNVHADQVEWMARNLRSREGVILSLHPHNDRGTAVAAAELGLAAGAHRVEGTLFGNGERTGNVCIVTMAMNLFSQGIDPMLDFSQIGDVIEVYERTTRMRVHERHPYAGEFVYTAFSGSHQDAINKGLDARKQSGAEEWEVPYLPIDPADVGRTYEAVIRINSQSGKGGVAHIMERDFGFRMPKEMHPDFSRVVQAWTDRTGGEASPEQLKKLFDETYLSPRCRIKSGHTEDSLDGGDEHAEVTVVIFDGEREFEITGRGNGPVDAFVKGLSRTLEIPIVVKHFSEHAIGEGSDSAAVCYIGLEAPGKGVCFGVGIDASIATASMKAVLSALGSENMSFRANRRSREARNLDIL